MTTPQAIKFLVGSGWWCSHQQDQEVNPQRQANGDETIRSVAFFDSWLDSLHRTSTPDRIVVIDSHAPVKPSPENREKVTWIELPFNAKHSTNHTGQWSGWTRSVMLSGQYAITAEAEYFVYVEQDCLLVGEDIFNTCERHMRKGLMFGSGAGTPQPLQQSFFIIRKDKLASFLYNLQSIKDSDATTSPEWKFVLASWRPFVWASNLGLLRHRVAKRWIGRLAQRFCFEHLPFEGGRTRPLDWQQDALYFQHASLEELETYQRRQQS